MFVLLYSNEDDAKRYTDQRYYLPKCIIKNYNVIINDKNFLDQPIDSDIKWYDERRNLTTEQNEDYATGCLLDYEYFESHYRLIAVDLRGQKELNADSKAIQQKRICWKIEKCSQCNCYWWIWVCFSDCRKN